jgi:hypothetical protein
LCVSDNGVDTLSIALRRQACDPRSKVINKRDRASVRVDTSLHQIGVEEEKQDWR